MPLHGYRIEWTQLNGHQRAVQARSLESPEAALAQAWDAARFYGWRPRRWWQVWRPADRTHVTMLEPVDAG